MELIVLMGIAIMFAFAPGAVAARLARVPVALIIAMIHLRRTRPTHTPSTAPRGVPYIEVVDCQGQPHRAAMPQWLWRHLRRYRRQPREPPKD